MIADWCARGIAAALFSLLIVSENPIAETLQEMSLEKNGVVEIYNGGKMIWIPENITAAQISVREALLGNPVRYDRFRADGWIFEWLVSDYYDDDGEDAVLFVSRGGDTADTQMIRITGKDKYGAPVAPEHKFQYMDVNFDNLPDLLICAGHHGNQGAISYYCFIQTKDGFVEAPSFIEIANPSVDVENKMILSQSRGGASTHYWSMYQWQDNECVLYRQLCEESVREEKDSGETRVWVWSINGEEAARDDELSEEEIVEFLYGENSEWRIADDRWRTIYNHGMIVDYSIYNEP
ncbi:MAG: hypothetical protein NC321_14450 [Clostridium sp.]|nr:hypothetical protein [Clostridium sp.]